MSAKKNSAAAATATEQATKAKRERKFTDRVLIGRATVWAAKNKDKLDNMPFDDIVRMMRGQFAGHFISDEAIKDICKSADIRRLRGPRSKINKQDKLRTLARVVLEVLNTVEAKLGESCCSDEGRHVLEKLKAGAKHEWDGGVEQSEGT